MVRSLKNHIFLTILITLVVVFVTGILLGRHIERSAESEISDFLKENELITESYLLEQALIKESGDKGCELAKTRISELSAQLGQIGRRLSMEDVDKILGETNFNLLKRRYHLMQIRTYFMYEQLKDSCDMEQEIVLFYYGSDNGISTEQGKILDEIVEREKITVLAVEYNYSEELNFIEYFYNITSTPSLVVNFNTTLTGLQDPGTLGEVLFRS